MLSESFKKAVRESVNVNPEHISEKLNKLFEYSRTVLAVDDSENDRLKSDKELSVIAEARISLVLEYAESLGFTEGEYIVFTILLAQGI